MYSMCYERRADIRLFSAFAIQVHGLEMDYTEYAIKKKAEGKEATFYLKSNFLSTAYKPEELARVTIART